MSITENKDRIGSFTSSNIWKLATMNPKKDGFGAPGLAYIQEKRMELRMGRSIETEAYSQSMAWGTFLEMYVFTKIGMEYEITSNDTDVHPTMKGWSGSKDLIVKGKKISDIKCFYPKKFGAYTDALLSKDVELIRKKFATEYWQLLSNAIINGVSKAEAITFMPYEDELEEIKEMVEQYEGGDIWKYRFIYENDKSSLPYLPRDKYYKNLNKFEFEIPKEDVEFLTERVKSAIKILKA